MTSFTANVSAFYEDYDAESRTIELILSKNQAPLQLNSFLADSERCLRPKFLWMKRHPALERFVTLHLFS